MSEIWGTGEGQRQLSRIALGMVMARATTPTGQWVEETYGSTYEQLWEDATALAGNEAYEYLFLDMMNLAAAFANALAEATGRVVGDIIHDEYQAIERLRFEGEDD